MRCIQAKLVVNPHSLETHFEVSEQDHKDLMSLARAVQVYLKDMEPDYRYLGGDNMRLWKAALRLKCCKESQPSEGESQP